MYVTLSNACSALQLLSCNESDTMLKKIVANFTFTSRTSHLISLQYESIQVITSQRTCYLLITQSESISTILCFNELFVTSSVFGENYLM